MAPRAGRRRPSCRKLPRKQPGGVYIRWLASWRSARLPLRRRPWAKQGCPVWGVHCGLPTYQEQE
eukprot:6992107-Lingulodinium_polyedra.AAC.1